MQIAEQAELVELRLDLLNLGFDDLSKLFKLDTKFLVTHRLGEFLNDLSSGYMKNIIDLGADYIDIEFEEENKYVDDLIEYAQQNSCKVVLSYHNYEYTPDTAYLNEIIKIAKNKKADYVKIATKVSVKSDVAKILSLYQENDKLIAFGMGEIGKISRLASLYLGAEFTYVAWDKDNKTAEGQYTFDEMKKIIELI